MTASGLVLATQEPGKVTGHTTSRWGAPEGRPRHRPSCDCGAVLPERQGREAVPVVVDEARHRPLLLEDLDARGRRLLIAGALGDPAQQLVGGDLDVLGDVGIARVAA